MIVDHTRVGAAFRRLSIPSGVAQLGDQLLGIADTIAIGALGTVALAGATAANVAFVIVLFAMSGFLTGMSIIGSQRIGARDVEGYASAVRAGAVAPLVIAFTAIIASFGLATPAIHAMVGPIASLHASATYLILRCFCLLPIAVSGTLIVGLGAAGNRKLGILVLAIINIVHIPLLLVLALGWLTHRPYGIVGAGVSSLVSELIAMVFAIVYVARRPVYAIFKRLTIDVTLAIETARLSLPEAVFLLGVMLPDAFIVAMLAPFGTALVAGYRALNVVSDLTFVVPSPLQSATQTVVGQRLGARDIAGAQHFFVRARRLSFLIASATGCVVALLAWPLAYLFTLNASVATLAALPLALHMTTLPIKGWAMVSLAPIRAAGDTQFSMFVGLVTVVLAIPAAYVSITILHLGLFGVPIAWIFAWSARALMTAVKLRKRSWTTRAPLTSG